MRLAGVDGCNGGWVVARAGTALAGVTFELVTDLCGLFEEAASGRATVAIDMPIGLPDDGPRACDAEARTLLGVPRGSSVFSAPCRATLAAAGYRDACRLNAEACGRMLSQQSYQILPKIRAVDALITPALQHHVREAHPELVFALLSAQQRGLVLSKKTPAGEAERLSLLAQVLPDFLSIEGADPLGAIRARLGRGRVARDDIVDAAACLVAAHRFHTGAARVLPATGPARDARGLCMEIVA